MLKSGAKPYLLMLGLSLALGCQPGTSAEQEKAIEAVSQEWDGQTLQVTTQVADILELQKRAAKAAAALDSLSTQEAKELAAALGGQKARLDSLSEASFAFVNQWQEGAEQLYAIKSDAEEGKTAKPVAPLQELLQEAKAKSKAWAPVLQTARQAITDAESYLDSER